jgi:hypothetical protein
MVARAGCTNVAPVHADFLAVDPRDPKFARATHMYVVPAASLFL